MNDAVLICRCGHPDFLHTREPGEPGDCLQRSDNRFDCPCDQLEPEETNE